MLVITICILFSLNIYLLTILFIEFNFTKCNGIDFCSHILNSEIIIFLILLSHFLIYASHDKLVEDMIDSVRQGQIIEISGALIRADANDNWHWQSSLSRAPVNRPNNGSQ